jgi:hypothetical protein
MQPAGIYQIHYPKEYQLWCSPARVRYLGKQLRKYADSLESIRPPAEPVTKETIKLNKWINKEKSIYYHLYRASCVPIIGTTVMIIHRNWAVGRRKRGEVRNDIPNYYPQEVDEESGNRDQESEPLIIINGRANQIAQEVLKPQQEAEIPLEFEAPLKPGLVLVYPEDLQEEVVELSNEINIKNVKPLTINSRLLHKRNLPDNKFLMLVFHRAKIKDENAFLQGLMTEPRKFCKNVVLVVLDSRKGARSTVYDHVEHSIYQKCLQESVEDPLLGNVKSDLIEKIIRVYTDFVHLPVPEVRGS